MAFSNPFCFKNLIGSFLEIWWSFFFNKDTTRASVKRRKKKLLQATCAEIFFPGMTSWTNHFIWMLGSVCSKNWKAARRAIGTIPFNGCCATSLMMDCWDLKSAQVTVWRTGAGTGADWRIDTETRGA